MATIFKRDIWIDTGSYLSPVSISSIITPPSDNMARVFVVGSPGPIIATMGNGSFTQEVQIIGTDNTNTVKLTSGTNVILSGLWVGRKGSILKLQWLPDQSAWLEVARNEI